MFLIRFSSFRFYKLLVAELDREQVSKTCYYTIMKKKSFRCISIYHFTALKLSPWIINWMIQMDNYKMVGFLSNLASRLKLRLCSITWCLIYRIFSVIERNRQGEIESEVSFKDNAIYYHYHNLMRITKWNKLQEINVETLACKRCVRLGVIIWNRMFQLTILKHLRRG